MSGGYAIAVKQAILALGERTGSSQAAIEKYIIANKSVSDFKRHFLRASLKAATTSGKLVRIKNSWKVSAEVKKADAKAAKKAAAPKKAAPKKVVKKASPKKKAAPKKAAPKKKTAVVKKASPKKKAVTKKVVKKVTVKSPKKAAPKKAASKKKASLSRTTTLVATVRGPGKLRAKSRKA